MSNPDRPLGRYQRHRRRPDVSDRPRGRPQAHRLPTRAGARVTDVRVDEPTRLYPHTKEEAGRGTPSGPVESGCFRRGGCWSASPEFSAFSRLRGRAGTGYGSKACALAQGWCLTAYPPIGSPRRSRPTVTCGTSMQVMDVVHEQGLTLVHPAHPYAPTTEYPAPARLCVPRAQQRPMTIQLPGPSRARARAARLATAMTTHAGDRAVVSSAVPTGPRDSRLTAGRAGGPRRPAPGGQPATNTSR
jgi:hypothetical protein